MRAELLAGAAELSASLFSSAPASASGDGAESSFAMLHGLYWLAANFASRGRRCSSSTTCIGPTSRRCAGSSISPVASRGYPCCCSSGRGHLTQANVPALVTELLGRSRSGL